MGPPFDVPGMPAMAILILVIQLFSLFVMVAIVLAFQRVRRKQERLLAVLTNSPPEKLLRHTIFLWTYVALTLSISAVTTAIFLFQPHLL